MDKGRRPPLPNLDRHVMALARIAAETSFLPAPETVRELGRAVFPSVRYKNGKPRLALQNENDIAVAMYDDNMTPRWTMLWAHGYPQTHHPQGWTIAHVWSATDDMSAYTHLANLALVPECLASLTDKVGPLTGFLRWHAWTVYNWKPAAAATPQRPDGYEQITWQYLDKIDDPWGFIQARLGMLKNDRVKLLRPIMERMGTL